MVFIGAMQGAGDTKRPLWITIWSLWGIRVPLSFFLTLSGFVTLFGFSARVGLGWGPIGTWIAISGTQAIQGLFSYLAFARGEWKLQKV
jgi:Na+-driven multidrug efflux pump